METIQRVTAILEDENLDMDDDDNRDLPSTLEEMVNHCMDCVKYVSLSCSLSSHFLSLSLPLS